MTSETAHNLRPRLWRAIRRAWGRAWHAEAAREALEAAVAAQAQGAGR